ncbi:FGGY-family carbohydrate kinase [Leucobacter sp. HY1908]
MLGELLTDAARIRFTRPVFDVNDPVFMPPGNIPGRITAWYTDRGERPPGSPAEMVRCIVESLAQAFADAVVTAASLADRSVSVIHILGGGSLNALLCQRLADRAGLPVLAGPVEATAMGNLLVQAQALGQIADGLPALRAVVGRSSQLVTYTPR